MQGQMRPGSLNAASSAAIARGDIRLGTAGPNKSRYRGVSYDKKKRKWRVQIKVRADIGDSTFARTLCWHYGVAVKGLLLLCLS